MHSQRATERPTKLLTVYRDDCRCLKMVSISEGADKLKMFLYQLTVYSDVSKWCQ